jgi:hypothetical protein
VFATCLPLRFAVQCFCAESRAQDSSSCIPKTRTFFALLGLFVCLYVVVVVVVVVDFFLFHVLVFVVFFFFFFLLHLQPSPFDFFCGSFPVDIHICKSSVCVFGSHAAVAYFIILVITEENSHRNFVVVVAVVIRSPLSFFIRSIIFSLALSGFSLSH